MFGTAYKIVTSAASGAGLRPGDQALIVPRLVDSVLRPLADALGIIPPVPGGAAGHGRHRRVTRAGRARRFLVRNYRPGRHDDGRRAGVGGGPGSDRAAGTPGPARLACPPELAEAIAALQDLASG